MSSGLRPPVWFEGKEAPAYGCLRCEKQEKESAVIFPGRRGTISIKKGGKGGGFYTILGRRESYQEFDASKFSGS